MTEEQLRDRHVTVVELTAWRRQGHRANSVAVSGLMTSAISADDITDRPAAEPVSGHNGRDDFNRA